MDNATNQTVALQNGMDVYGADGDKVGSIQDVQDDYVVVAKGFFFPKDYYIPWSSIDGVTDDNKVYLLVTKDEALDQNWDTVPVVDTTTAPYGTTVGTSEVIAPDYTAQTGASTTSADATRVPIYEEQVTPVKRQVSRGAVRIEKKLVTEDRTVTVPVTEERVRVTRVDTNEPVSADTTILQEGEIEVPLQGEEVTLEKTARKTGEVVVEKEADLRQQQVGGTVRREEVVVDDATVDERSKSRRNA